MRRTKKTDPNQYDLDFEAGAHLRDTGIAHLADAHPAWLERALAELTRLVDQQSIVTADSISHIELPHPNCAGVLFRTAALRGIIRPFGFTQAQAATCHARVIRTWVKAERQDRAA